LDGDGIITSQNVGCFYEGIHATIGQGGNNVDEYGAEYRQRCHKNIQSYAKQHIQKCGDKNQSSSDINGDKERKL